MGYRVPEECPSVSSPRSLYFLASVVLGVHRLWREEEAFKSAPAVPWANEARGGRAAIGHWEVHRWLGAGSSSH